MNTTTMTMGWMGLVLAAALLALTGCDRGGEHAHEGASDGEHQHEEEVDEARLQEAEAARARAAERSEEEIAQEREVREAAAEEARRAPTEAPREVAGQAQGEAPAMGADHETIEVDESEIVAQPGAQMGDAARCPVSGETFRVRETSASVELDGETYYFCCGSCVRPFTRDPDQYL